MKPFNLEEAKAGKPVVTKKGKPVRILCFDRNHDKYPIVALVPVSSPEMDMLCIFTEEGRFAAYSGYEKDAYTLYMKTEKKTGYVIIRKNDREVKCSGTIFHDIRDAARLSDPEKEVVADIEWEE